MKMQAAPEAQRRAAGDLTLAGFEALVRLVDDVDATLAAHDAIVAMAAAQRFQRITDFHNVLRWTPRGGGSGCCDVGDT